MSYAELVDELNAEAERLSGHSIDRGSVDAGIASILASKAATAIETVERERDEARKKLAALLGILHTDEAFIGSHWEPDFRAPDAVCTPVLAVNFRNYAADGEDIPEEDWLLVFEAVEAFGNDAVQAYACFKRGLNDTPKGRLSVKGQAALEFFRGREALKDTSP